MKNMDFLETLGHKDFMITFSFLFIVATVIIWCLTSAIMGPLNHISCPLLSVF